MARVMLLHLGCKKKQNSWLSLSLIHICFLEAHDMTIEAVVTKSMWLLAQNCESFDQLQQRFYRQVNFDTFYH